jgi:hypothetical protein
MISRSFPSATSSSATACPTLPQPRIAYVDIEVIVRPVPVLISVLFVWSVGFIDVGLSETGKVPSYRGK